MKKSQIWGMDYVIGVIMFLMTLVIAFNLTNNILSEKDNKMDDLMTDEKIISQILITSGYPTDWDKELLENRSESIKIGVSNKPNFLNESKLKELNLSDYNRVKELLGTKFDFYVYFIDKDENIKSIKGVCGVGNPDIAVNSTILKIGYYGNINQLMEPYAKSLDADIYLGNNHSFADNINKYSFFILENPSWNNASLSNIISQFVADGGTVFLSQGLESSTLNNFAGIIINKTNVSKSLNSTILEYDETTGLNRGNTIYFTHAVFVRVNTNVTNFTKIAEFPQINHEASVASWNFGDGTVYFASDFDDQYLGSTIKKKIANSLSKKAFLCQDQDLSKISDKSITKLSRFMIYNSEILKMEVLLWVG